MKQYHKDASAALTRITEYDYDASGRINQTKLYSPTNTLLASSVTNYDSWGNAKYTKDFIGHEAYFSYANTDSQNTFGASGFTNSFYTPLTISANIHSALVGRAELQNGPSSANMETYYKYDSVGNLLEQKQIHNVAGYPTAWLLADYTSDSYGNRLSTTDALGRVTYFRYSSTYQSAYLTKTSILTGTQNVTTTYTYDFGKGFLLSRTDPDGFITSFSYDLLGRTTGITYPPVGGVPASKAYLYDDPNNILTTSDENGNVAKQYFDGLARQTKIERWNVSSVYSSETYSLNWLDKVATKTTAAGSTYTYTYDSLGRLTQLNNPGTTYQTTSYDDVNNIKTVTDENGHFKRLAYDWNNRLTSVKEDNSSTNFFLTAYVYDHVGHLLTLIDARNRLTNETKLISGARYSTLYTYDKASNVVSIKYPDTFLLSLTYDAVNRVKKVGSFATVAYTVDDKMQTITFGSGEVATYTYDNRDRPTRILDKIGNTKNLDLNYTYDGTGNVLTLNTETYGYDWLDRLNHSNGPWTAITYTYDQVGNRVKMVQGSTTTYAYGSFNRLSSAGSTTYTYDANGNMITKNDGFSWTFTYDYDNRLTKVVHAGTTALQNAYDGNGKRIKKTESEIGRESCRERV